MNKVFISGKIAERPMLRKEAGEIPHLTLRLSVRHRAKSGELRREIYRVSAWHSAAEWGVENLSKGQVIGVQGYLTQRRVNAGNIAAVETEIAVDEFLPMRPALQEDSAEAAEAQPDKAACCVFES